MRYIVEIVKKSKGFKVGEKKSLTLEVANHLESKGIGKIVSEASSQPTEKAKELAGLVTSQGEKITELEAKIVDLEAKVEKLKSSK